MDVIVEAGLLGVYELITRTKHKYKGKSLLKLTYL